MFTPADVPLFGGGTLAVHRGVLFVTQGPRGTTVPSLCALSALPGEATPATMPSYALCKPTVLRVSTGYPVLYRGVADQGYSLVSYQSDDAPTRVRNEHLRPMDFPVGDLAILDMARIVRVLLIDGALRRVWNYQRRAPETVALTRLFRLERVNVDWNEGGLALNSPRAIYFNTVGSDPTRAVFRTPGTFQDFCVNTSADSTRFGEFMAVQHGQGYSFDATREPVPQSSAAPRRARQAYPAATSSTPLRTVVRDDAT